MLQKIEKTIKSPTGRDFSLDYRYPDLKKIKAVVLFAHGFKGFKDWGGFNAVAEEIASAGSLFIKFNFSHNGTDPENPVDFVDLKAFSENTFRKELMDYEEVLSFTEELMKEMGISTLPIYLMGHSRGGYTTILKALMDDRITKAVAWAPVADVKARFESNPQFQEWKKNGISHILNGRTNQNMPLLFDLAEEVMTEPSFFDLKGRLEHTDLKLCCIHGTSDTSVPHTDSEKLYDWSFNTELLIVEGADHTFGMVHPGTNELPVDSMVAIEKTIHFFLDS
mgnify:CR=1 FL=1